MLWFFPAIVVLVLCLFLWWKFRRRGLSASSKKKIASQWQTVLNHDDPHRRLLEADAVLGHLLKELGHAGSVADQLRSAQSIIPGLQDVWAAHKLRNRIAHEPGIGLTDAEVSRAIQAFNRVIRKFCP